MSGKKLIVHLTAEMIERFEKSPLRRLFDGTPTPAGVAAGGEYQRCRGDGVHACGHDPHEGRCRKSLRYLNKTDDCACEGTKR